jgi:hypothetical protein
MAADQQDLLVRRVLRSRELQGLVAAAAVAVTVVTTVSQCGSGAKKPAPPATVISGNGNVCNAQGSGAIACVSGSR